MYSIVGLDYWVVGLFLLRILVRNHCFPRGFVDWVTFDLFYHHPADYFGRFLPGLPQIQGVEVTFQRVFGTERWGLFDNTN